MRDLPSRPESVELARAQFLQVQGLPSSPRTSTVSLQDGSSRHEKGFRDSLRTSESAQSQEHLEQPHGVVKSVRSISSSIRSRFKRAFSKPSSGLPPQQLDASRAYFGDATFGEAVPGGFDSYQSDGIADLRRASLCDPWHETIDEDDLHRLSLMAPVNKSSGSLTADSKSRVTSWTNTTTSGSLRETAMERKRLSVIQEDGGPHQPSCSAGTHIGGVAVFRKPPAGHSAAAPDPQRLYSALVRRMNEDSPEHLAIHEEIEGEEEHDISWPRQTIRAVLSPSTLPPEDKDIRASEFKQSGPPESDTKGLYSIGYAASEESVYSGPRAFPRREATSSALCVPISQTDVAEYQDLGTNPYDDGVPETHTGNAQPQAEASSQTANVGRSQRVGGAAHVRQVSEHNARYRVMPNADLNKSRRTSGDEQHSQKAPSHVRERAQIEPDYSSSTSRKALAEPLAKSFGTAREPGRIGDIDETRNLTPSVKVPDQLSVAKKRFPLLNVKEVTSKNTPITSRSSSLTRSQSGLLQLAADQAANQTIEDNKKAAGHEKDGKIAASLRKISPENVANLLRSKMSKAILQVDSEQGKENRPATAMTESEGDDFPAASTPGPSYLAMRSGNSGSSNAKREKPTAVETDSPTDMVKATLSARLSRPFNMDTPELNRPFDSMYLGKRELGFNDTIGGRLSVAQKALGPHSYDKRRSFERGPGGYGGLGPSPFETPGKSTEETALPHIPTPEDQAKDNKVRTGMNLNTKRIVSNFLRSRRKAASADNEGQASHEEHVKATPPTGSPLFI